MLFCVFKVEQIFSKRLVIRFLNSLQSTQFLSVFECFNQVFADFILLLIIGNTITGKSINSVAFFTYRKVIEYTLS